MRRLMGLVFVFVFSVSILFAGQLSPELKKLYTDWTKNSEKVVNNINAQKSNDAQNAIVRMSGSEILISATISVESTAAFDLLGIAYNRITDSVITADIPLSAVAYLEESSTVTYVQMAYMNEPHNDIAIPKMNTDDLHTAGYYGEDVLVGIVDSGIDITHSAFKIDGVSSNGSRILYLWDQTVTGPDFSVGTFSTTLGRLWTKAEIDGGSCTETDTSGHGTHVAGSFAGYDTAFTGRQGSATKANILFVKTNFSSTEVTNAVRYLYAQAQQIGKPIIINMSLGSQYGPHDGTAVDTKAIDDLIAGSNGDLMVIRSAGNDADGALHDSATISTTAVSMPFTVPAYTPSSTLDDYAGFFFYYDSTYSVSVRVKDSAGNWTSWIAPGSTNNTTMGDGSLCYISNSSSAESYNSAIKRIYIYIGEDTNGDGKYIRSGNWDMEFKTATGSTTGHIWMWEDVNGYSTFSNPDPDYSLGNGACGQNVITVGAYVSRYQWAANDGNTYNYTGGYAQDDIAPFSSRGPTRDGRSKPDIIAPGSNILSTKSVNATASNTFLPPNSTDPGTKKYMYMQGTSMASPLAAGAILLIKQLNPTWEYDDVINYFKTNSQNTTVHTTAGTWDNIWGWGVIDTTNAVGLQPFELTSHSTTGFYSYKTGEDVTFSWETAGTGATYVVAVALDTGGTLEWEQRGTTTSTTLTDTAADFFQNGYGKYRVRIDATKDAATEETSVIQHIYYTSLNSPQSTLGAYNPLAPTSQFVLFDQTGSNFDVRIKWADDSNNNTNVTYTCRLDWTDLTTGNLTATVSSDSTYEWFDLSNVNFGAYKNTYLTIKFTVSNNSTPTDRIYFEKQFYVRNVLWEILPNIYNDNYLNVVALGQNFQGSELTQQLLRLNADSPAFDGELTANGNGIYLSSAVFNTMSFPDAAVFKMYYNNGTAGSIADDVQIGSSKTKTTFRLNQNMLKINGKLSLSSATDQMIYTLSVNYPELAGVSAINGDIMYIGQVKSAVQYSAVDGYKLMKWENDAWRDCTSIASSGYYVVTSGTIPGLKYKNQLTGNYPNPFNPETDITFTVEKAQKVTLELFTSQGKKIKSVDVDAVDGTNSWHWNGRDENGRELASGMYYCVLKVSGKRFVRTMVMLK